nr:hypothetical protein [Angustibacter aerolatus]
MVPVSGSATLEPRRRRPRCRPPRARGWRRSSTGSPAMFSRCARTNQWNRLEVAQGR